ncbi:hypothetical protein G7Y79_00073g098420 [Physcia stellaris]|nr:hypothetical protein G7Y79_00073g098420 [Physcia stellaris]
MNNTESKRLEDDHPPTKKLKLSNRAPMNLYTSSTASVRILPKHSPISADLSFQDQPCAVDMPFHIVTQCDLTPTSNLQVGTKISPSDTIETVDGLFLKIKRISQDELGTIKLYGDVFIPHDRVHGLLPEIGDEVYWLWRTTPNTDDPHPEEKSVAIQHVKQLRELTLITVESPAFARYGEWPTADLICRWRYVAAADLSTFQALTPGMINTTRVQSPIGDFPLQAGNRKRKRSPETSPTVMEYGHAQGISASFEPGSSGFLVASDMDIDASDTDSDAGRMSCGSQDVGSHVYWEYEDVYRLRRLSSLP